MMNWGLFHKKMKNWNSAYRYFVFCFECGKKLENSGSPQVLRTLAKVRIPLASFYMEYERYQLTLLTLNGNILKIHLPIRYKDAQEVLDSAVSILQTDLTMHYKNIQGRKGYNGGFALRKSVPEFVS